MTVFFTPVLANGFYWSLSDSKSLQYLGFFIIILEKDKFN